MAVDKDLLIRYRIDRAKETIKEADDAIKMKNLFNAENRIYYTLLHCNGISNQE